MPDDQTQPTSAPAATHPAPPVSSTPSYVGVIDRLLQGRLSGWAVTMDGDPCDVLIRVNGAVVATVLSDGPRPDLHAKQQSRGLGGWGLGIGAQLTDGENRIEALSPDGAHLRGSPLIHDTKASDGIVPIAAAGPKTYSGAIDTPNQPVIFGWAVGSDLTEASVVVRINDGDAITIPANLPRSDLIAKQLTRSGGGWRIVAADMLAPGTNRISITFPDGAHLPGSPFERTLEGGTPVAAPVRSPPPAPTPAVSPFGRAKRPSPEDAAAPSAPAPVAAVQTHAQALAPFSKPAQPPAAAPAPSNVRPFPARTGKGGMPSLPELDELSLDDLSHAIAAGIIDVAPPPAPEPVPDPMAEESDGAVNKAQRSQNRAGFLARLFGRG